MYIHDRCTSTPIFRIMPEQLAKTHSIHQWSLEAIFDLGRVFSHMDITSIKEISLFCEIITTLWKRMDTTNPLEKRIFLEIHSAWRHPMETAIRAHASAFSEASNVTLLNPLLFQDVDFSDEVKPSS